MTRSQPMPDFPLLSRKPIHVDFSGGALSSDGGLLLLASLDRTLGLTQALADGCRDARRPQSVQHPLRDLIRQRVFQLALGYEDQNDADTLRDDPALKLACGRAPFSQPHLASQPTLSRLEAMLDEDACDHANDVLLAQFLDASRPRPRTLTLDLDTSEHVTHGQQELAFYNEYYGSRCYLPRFLFASAGGERDQYLVRAELPDHHGEQTDAILESLEAVVGQVRQRWPGVALQLRADAGFADPELYTFLEAHQIAYAISLKANEVLMRLSEPAVAAARKAAVAAPTGRATVYRRVWYQAGSWEKRRRVIVKVTVTPSEQKIRFLVTSGLCRWPKAVFAFYAGRGDSENRIKELKEGVRSDRLSCREYASNKVRLMLASVAYVLLQGLRRLARGTEWGRAQVSRLRLGLLKIGARVVESSRRVVVELCSSYPWQETWGELVRRRALGRP
jgi:hypothetical protein